MPLHPDEYLGHFWRDGLGLAVAAESAGLGAPVASCPGWSVADLVWHAGEVFWFWAEAVDHRWPDPNEYVEPDRPGDGALVDRLVGVLRSAEPSQPVWSWAPRGGTAGWVTRRVAHEAAVHRWDAENAARTGWTVDAALAADGVDEFFEHFSDNPAVGAAPVGGTVHLHCTDGDGEWLVEEPDPTGPLVVRREHAKGDVAVRGPAADLLLLLWRRRGIDGLEVFGDAAIAERLVARADLR
jgi:uncharacterized protein (TIGR03083 family)